VIRERFELVLQVYDAMNRRDVEALRALGERFPNYRWRNAPDMPQTADRDSAAGLAYVEQEVFGTFDRNHTEIEEVVHIGPQTAALAVRHSVRGAASGAEVQRREVHLWRVDDDWSISMREFLTLDEAREAAS
jgi:ketosteroid isomerase-like protein